MTLWLASETIIISLSSWVVVSRPAWLIIVIELQCSLIRTHADDHISELYLFDTPIMMSCIQAQLLYWHGKLYNVISYFPRFPDVVTRRRFIIITIYFTILLMWLRSWASSTSSEGPCSSNSSHKGWVSGPARHLLVRELFRRIEVRLLFWTQFHIFIQI